MGLGARGGALLVRQNRRRHDGPSGWPPPDAGGPGGGASTAGPHPAPGAGDFTILLGPPGSGKTTFLRTLAGLNRRHTSLKASGQPAVGLRRAHCIQGPAWCTTAARVPACLPAWAQVQAQELSYNGRGFDEFVVERSAAYVSQARAAWPSAARRLAARPPSARPRTRPQHGALHSCLPPCFPPCFPPASTAGGRPLRRADGAGDLRPVGALPVVWLQERCAAACAPHPAPPSWPTLTSVPTSAVGPSRLPPPAACPVAVLEELAAKERELCISPDPEVGRLGCWPARPGRHPQPATARTAGPPPGPVAHPRGQLRALPPSRPRGRVVTPMATRPCASAGGRIHAGHRSGGQGKSYGGGHHTPPGPGYLRRHRWAGGVGGWAGGVARPGAPGANRTQTAATVAAPPACVGDASADGRPLRRAVVGNAMLRGISGG